MKSKLHTLVGSIGATIGLFVFLAYIPQIISNLNGDKVSLGSHSLRVSLALSGSYTV